MLMQAGEDPKWRDGMQAAQAGDSRAYATLLHAAVPVIRATVRSRGVPTDQVDDALQDVLLTIHRVRHTYDPSRPFLPWLRAVARARAIDHLRRTGRYGAREAYAPAVYDAHPSDDPAADDMLAEAGRARRLRDAVALLPPGQRQALELLGLEQQSLAEASAQTGRSTVALKVNLHRALKTLRTLLGAP